MTNNRDLLKEAIADAKAVKETAIANAKAALEEAFTPHLKSMLSAKLEEMDKDEEVELEEMDAVSFDEKNGESIDAVPAKVGQTTVQEEEVDEEINLDELLAELEEGEDKDEVKESEEIEESEEVTEAEEDEDVEDVEDEEAEEATEEEEIDLEDMTEDDLKSFIEDVIKDMVEAGELEGGEEMESEEEGEEAGMEDEMDIEIEDEAEEIMESEEVEEYGSTRMKEPSDSAAAGLENIISGLKALVKKGGEVGKKAYAALEDLGAAAGAAMRNEEVEEMGEMDEIEELKKELQEVNLLNAKLLYTNKIFKAKNLSEDKKVKVLKAFDKAETVKEAKVIFETLNEGISSSISKPSSIVNEIKGSASKATGNIPNVKQPIVENDAFVRMQKLAGIIK
jgi:hypothetical protein